MGLNPAYSLLRRLIRARHLWIYLVISWLVSWWYWEGSFLSSCRSHSSRLSSVDSQWKDWRILADICGSAINTACMPSIPTALLNFRFLIASLISCGLGQDCSYISACICVFEFAVGFICWGRCSFHLWVWSSLLVSRALSYLMIWFLLISDVSTSCSCHFWPILLPV